MAIHSRFLTKKHVLSCFVRIRGRYLKMEISLGCFFIIKNWGITSRLTILEPLALLVVTNSILPLFYAFWQFAPFSSSINKTFRKSAWLGRREPRRAAAVAKSSSASMNHKTAFNAITIISEKSDVIYELIDEVTFIISTRPTFGFIKMISRFHRK